MRLFLTKNLVLSGVPFFKKLPHHGRFRFIDDQLALVFVVAEDAAVTQHHTFLDGLLMAELYTAGNI